MRLSCCFVLLGLAGTSLLAQQTPAPPPTPDSLRQLVAREFGSTFELLDLAPLFFDVDADGAEDAILVGTSKDPLLDETEFHYKVVDPYDDYFGLGDPHITSGFSPTYIGPPRYLLVLHDWRAATPKAKFVIINLPFEKLSAGRTLRKKKPIPAISAEESGGLVSTLFWNGKKYKWQPSFMAQ